jgi:hypothetical protein
VALFTPRCPVDDRERTWITENIEWLRDVFGDEPLSAPVILPTSEYFPPPFSGSDQDIRSAASRAAGYMGVQTDVDIEVSDNIDHIRALQRIIPAGTTRSAGAAGTYASGPEGGRPVITIDRSAVSDPVRLVAVIAHELGHVRLLSEGWLPAGRKDGEPLTDLATVYLRMGIFTANAAFSFSRLPADGNQRTSGWRAQRLGYMTEPMLGFALACHAMLRAEPDPPWARYLDTNPRVYMKHGIRYLRHTMSRRPGGQPR